LWAPPGLSSIYLIIFWTKEEQMKTPRHFLSGAAVGALTSTLVLIAATALAGTGIGAVFNLGKSNKVNKQTTLQGNTDAQLLRVNNKGGGPALSLLTEPGVQPITTNSTTTVGNLSAGLLDGKDSTEFLAVDGKAVDAAHADTADLATNATNASTAASANNSNLLDGLDSKDFVKETSFYRVTINTDGQELGGGADCPDGALCFARADCDAGDKAMGGGFRDLDNGTRLAGSSPGLDLLETQPSSFGWVVLWVNNSTEDTVSVSVLCADMFP
jgi:hypothetical protein